MDKRLIGFVCFLWSIMAVAMGGMEKPPETGLMSRDDPRVQEIAGMLGDAPVAFGRPISDRAAWAQAAKAIDAAGLLRRAEKELATPMPDPSDELYLQCSKTGNRSNYEKPYFQLRSRLNALVLAECVENKGRFLPQIETTTKRICDLKSWLFPAHDLSLANFEQRTFQVDLGVVDIGRNMATMLCFLGEKLSPEVRKVTADNLKKRLIDPYLGRILDGKDTAWWLTTTSNWNAVCLSGATATCLMMLESKQDRALAIAAAERYSKNGLVGFAPDGYCTEGIGYWSYGFGHYVRLADTVYLATRGGLNLYERPRVRAAALFPIHLEIAPGLWPAYADCPLNPKPDARILTILNDRLGLGLERYSTPLGFSSGVDLSDTSLYVFPGDYPKMRAGEVQEDERRFFFDSQIVLTGRPGAQNPLCRLSVSLKGGHNGEHHNHNDVGSYLTVVAGNPVTLDPGGEVYTRWTFSSKRYESQLLNSYGHPVPVVAGRLQREGEQACAKVVSTSFSDTIDVFAIDLIRAYDVPELASLVRTFSYSREGLGSLTVSDAFEFMSPETFETALVTYGDWEQTAADTLVVTVGLSGVEVKFASTAGPLRIAATTVKGQTHSGISPTRIGFAVDGRTLGGSVTLTLRALPPVMSKDGGLLRNGGFEKGASGWALRDNGMSEISTEQAASGKSSLKITDRSDKDGSSATAAQIPIEGAGNYVLRGRYYGVSGENGLGVYINLRDAQSKPLNADERGWWVNVIGNLGGSSKKWEEFRFPFKTTAQAASIELWLHSYSASQVEVYLDDLELLPADKAK